MLALLGIAFSSIQQQPSIDFDKLPAAELGATPVPPRRTKMPRRVALQLVGPVFKGPNCMQAIFF